MKTLKEKISDYLWTRELAEQFYKDHQDEWMCEICSHLNSPLVTFCEVCHQVKDVH